MITIGTAVGLLRGRIKEHNSESYYTDQQLYEEILLKRATLLASIMNRSKITDWVHSEYCVALETTKAHDCDCVKVGCNVKKSVTELPTTVGLQGFQVLTLSHNTIGQVTPQRVKAEKSHPYLNGKRRYSIINRKLVIWNDLNLKAVIVRGVWEDPLTWLDKQLCNDNGDVFCITDPLQLPLQIKREHLDLVLSTIVKEMFPLLQIPQDMTNDSKEKSQLK